MRRALAGVAAAVAALTACADGDSKQQSGPSPSPSPVVAAALAAVPPVEATSLLQHRFVIDGGPDYLAVTNDAVWVKTDSGTLQRIDPATNRVTRTVKLGTELCQGMGSAGDAVWACDDTGVARVDSRTGGVTDRVAVGKVREQGTYPVGHGRIWVIGGDAMSVTGIDLATRKAVTTVPLGTRCGGAAVSAAHVWVTCRNDDLLLRIDPASGAVDARLTLLESPTFVSARDDAVYVAYRDGVARLDAATSAVTAAVRASSEFGMVLAAPTGVWVRSKENYLRLFDASTLALVRDVTSPEKVAGSVAVGFGSVWASGADDNAGTVQRMRA